MDGMLSHIMKVLEAKNVFERNRKKLSTRALGTLLYHHSLLLEIVKQWYQAMRWLAMRLSVFGIIKSQVYSKHKKEYMVLL